MEKKPFIERYKEWRSKVDSWAADHTVLGFPVRHPSIFLIICFTVVLVVCGSLNASARKRAVADEVPNTSVAVPQPRVKSAIKSRSSYQLFSDDGYWGVYWLSNTNDSGDQDDYNHETDTDPLDSLRDASFDVHSLTNSLTGTDYSYVRFTYWRDTYYIPTNNLVVNSDQLEVVGGNGFQIDFELCDVNGVTSVYTTYLSYAQPNYEFPSDMYLKSFTLWCGRDARVVSLVSGDMSGYSQGYHDGYANGYDAGKDSGYQQGYNVGKEDGFNLGQSSDMTLTTLFWSVIDEPFAIIYRLLNFDVLGVNIFGFVCGIVTLGLVGFIIKLVV